MTTIGNFTKDGDIFTGTITTLALKAKATLKPTGKAAPGQPDYRVYSDGVEIGAAWAKATPESKPYLSVKLDDPSFNNPIYCRLVALGEGAHQLFWTR